MNSKRIIENNILLAQFMNFEALDLGNTIGWKGTDEFKNRLYYETDLIFHQSWDWILSVLDKVENEHDYFWKLEGAGIQIYEFSLTQYSNEDADQLELPEGTFTRTDARVSEFEDPRLEAIYTGLINFVQWHNSRIESLDL